VKAGGGVIGIGRGNLKDAELILSSSGRQQDRQ